MALGVLGRIDRLDAGTRAASSVPPAARRRNIAQPSPAADANRRRDTIAKWWFTVAAVVLLAALAFVMVAPSGLRMVPGAVDGGFASALLAPPAPLPVPSPTESYVVQARALFGR